MNVNYLVNYNYIAKDSPFFVHCDIAAAQLTVDSTSKQLQFKPSIELGQDLQSKYRVSKSSLFRLQIIAHIN